MKAVVSNYGVGENSVLLVNRAILEGVKNAGWLAGDITYRGPNVAELRYQYHHEAVRNWREYIAHNEVPDIVIGQGCYALELFREIKNTGVKTKLVLQHDSCHMRVWKELVDRAFEAEGLPERIALSLVERMEREYDYADYITVLSRLVQRSFNAQGLVHKVVYTGPQVIDLPRWYCEPRPDDGCEFRVMVAGQLRVAKGTHIVCRAWRKMKPGPNDELVFSGLVTPEHGMPERLFIEQEIAKTPNCRVLGWCKLKDMPQRYMACDIYCLPSFQEGSSMTITEAMACGRPVVCSRNSGSDLLEVFDGEIGKLVDAGDVDGLADALNWYRKNKDACIEHGLKARQLIEQRVGGIEDFGRRYVVALSRVLNGV